MGRDERKKYDEFLKAAAEKGIDVKQLKVKAKKAPAQKEPPAKKKARSEGSKAAQGELGHLGEQQQGQIPVFHARLISS